MAYNKEHFIEQLRIMRNGNSYKVSTEYYISLLKKGYLASFFANYKTFELRLTNNIENYPDNASIFPLPAQYS